MDVKFRRLEIKDIMYVNLATQRQFNEPAKLCSEFLTYLYDNRFSYTCEIDNTMAGFLISDKCAKGEVTISTIYVEPSYRRLGIARKLIHLSLESISEHLLAILKVCLMADTNNTIAIKLYESIGFQIESTRKNAYFDGSDGYIMCIDLKDYQRSNQ